jgi:hypothetical protein
MADADSNSLTENDVFTLIGHAEYLRLVRGQTDMPAYFFDLAARIARTIGDPELSRRADGIRDKGRSIDA